MWAITVSAYLKTHHDSFVFFLQDMLLIPNLRVHLPVPLPLQDVPVVDLWVKPILVEWLECIVTLGTAYVVKSSFFTFPAAAAAKYLKFLE